MSGLDLLLKTSIDFERTHQLVLHSLFERSSLAKYLFGISQVKSVLWEPKGQLFDLAILHDNDEKYIEIKVWSSLTESQINRQTSFLSKEQKTGAYILLGSSWFEYSNKTIRDNSKGSSIKIGYDEIIDSLNKLIIEPRQSSDVIELARGYRDSIQEQYDKWINGVLGQQKDKYYYYSLYWKLQKKLEGIDTAIYTVNNPGGQVYILNDTKWYSAKVDDTDIEIYFELVADRLCIKFIAKTEDHAIRRKIRDIVRTQIHGILDHKYKLIDSGRTGAYMTACQIDYDFSDITKIDQSVDIFKDVHNSMHNIAQGLQL